MPAGGVVNWYIRVASLETKDKPTIKRFPDIFEIRIPVLLHFFRNITPFRLVNIFFTFPRIVVPSTSRLSNPRTDPDSSWTLMIVIPLCIALSFNWDRNMSMNNLKHTRYIWAKPWVSVNDRLLGLLDPEDESTTILRCVGNYYHLPQCNMSEEWNLLAVLA